MCAKQYYLLFLGIEMYLRTCFIFYLGRWIIRVFSLIFNPLDLIDLFKNDMEGTGLIFLTVL